jgi:hypothetical protein
MALINYWRVWCETDGKWEEWYLPDGVTPSTCPTDTAHTITAAKSFIRGTSSTVNPVDGDGNQKVVTEPREGTEKYFYTHNLCDPCTWSEASATVTEASATDSGDQITWDVAGHDCFIDLKHGRLFKEDTVPNLSSYDVVVEVQTAGAGPWNAKTENSWGTADNDYTFDYENGKVVFNAAIGGTDLVRVSGKKKGGSLFTVKPNVGKRLKLEYVEVQYMTDIVMGADVVFSIYGYVQVFAPELWDQHDPPGPFPANTLIPLVEERYKKIQDFFQESTGPFPTIPRHGGDYSLIEVTGLVNIQDKLNEGYETLHVARDGADWKALMYVRTGDRAMKHPLITLPFQYLAFRDLRAAYGMEVRVTVDGDVPLGGTFAGVTFYCTSEDE